MTKYTMFEGCYGERGTILPLGKKTEHSVRMGYVYFFSQAAEDKDTCEHRFGYPKIMLQQTQVTTGMP